MGKPYWQPSLKPSEDRKEDFMMRQLLTLEFSRGGVDVPSVSRDILAWETEDCASSLLPDSMATKTLQTPLRLLLPAPPLPSSFFL